jgi:hypothetical protein
MKAHDGRPVTRRTPRDATDTQGRDGRPGTRRTPRYTAVAHFCRPTRPQKKIVTVYFQHVEQLRVAAALPLTATNSGGPVGTLQRNREAKHCQRVSAAHA